LKSEINLGEVNRKHVNSREVFCPFKTSVNFHHQDEAVFKPEVPCSLVNFFEKKSHVFCFERNLYDVHLDEWDSFGLCGATISKFVYFQMTILLRMDDKMNRQLTCQVSEIDTAFLLAQELVHFGFINEVCKRFLSAAPSDARH